MPSVGSESQPAGAKDVPGRVLVAKLGLDGHDVGAKSVARLLRDNGLEVVYLGIRQTPEGAVKVALEEDVDVFGLSILSGAHLPLLRRIFELLALEGETSLPVVVGGVIPARDREAIRYLGVREIFDPADSSASIVDRTKALVAEHRAHFSEESHPG
jgi:methylmalonyl-CoA mutase C-terminal domain/subunit